MQCKSICQYFFSMFFYRHYHYRKVTLKEQNPLFLLGIGLLMSFFQILYCSKPWKSLSCLHCCGCKQKQESIKVKEKEHFNSAVIKIRSFNEFTRPQSRQQLGTITEFSRNSSTRRLSLGEVDGWTLKCNNLTWIFQTKTNLTNNKYDKFSFNKYNWKRAFSPLKMLYHLLIMPQIIYHYVCLNLARHFELIITIIHAWGPSSYNAIY